MFYLDPIVLDSEFSEFGLILIGESFVIFLLFFGVDSCPSLGSFLLITHCDVFGNVLLVLGLKITFNSVEL